jgi:hypothetical protein
MYTRIQQRNLDRLSKKLNEGLSNLHEVWGHGCPTGFEPLTLEDITYPIDHVYKHYTSPNPNIKGEVFTGDISLFLY